MGMGQGPWGKKQPTAPCTLLGGKGHNPREEVRLEGGGPGGGDLPSPGTTPSPAFQQARRPGIQRGGPIVHRVCGLGQLLVPLQTSASPPHDAEVVQIPGVPL